MYTKIDTAQLLERINLAELVTSDLGQGKASGNWHKWRCPFHEDNDPSFGVHTDGHFYCFGCGAHGDAINYVMMRHGLDFLAACAWLDTKPGSRSPAPAPHPAPKEDPPDADWRTLAGEIVREANERLMHAPEAKRARDYLAGRGLTSGTIRTAQLGYVPGTVKDKWPTLHGLRVPPGILIPWVDHHGTLWRVNVRRPTQRKGERYRNIAGGSSHGLYIAGRALMPGVPMIVTEGEFDALVAYQAVGDAMLVVTLGSATKSLPVRWLPVFASAPVILAAHDNDPTGQAAAAKLARFSARVHRLALPDGKDITDFITGGGDFRALVDQALAERARNTNPAPRAAKSANIVNPTAAKPTNFAAQPPSGAPDPVPAGEQMALIPADTSKPDQINPYQWG